MPESYVCVKCGKVAKTKQALERHAAYHEDDRPFACEVGMMLRVNKKQAESGRN